MCNSPAKLHATATYYADTLTIKKNVIHTLLFTFFLKETASLLPFFHNF